MAGTVTITERIFSSVKLVKFAWVSSAGGAADGTSTEIYDGKLIAVTTDPDGVAAPTADYDIVLNDDQSHDVLLGNGADRHTANIEYIVEANLGAVAGSKLTLGVTNAGNAKEGVIYIWLR